MTNKECKEKKIQFVWWKFFFFSENKINQKISQIYNMIMMANIMMMMKKKFANLHVHSYFARIHS